MYGCATPARVEQMTIPSEEVVHYDGDTPLENDVTVESVTGGQDTNPLWTSEIGNDEFRQALEQSLAAANLLSPEENNAHYKLSAIMLSVNQPVIGVSMTVTTTIQYVLIDITSNKELLIETIVAPYTAKFSDALLGVERLKLANEGSARANITQLIQKLYELKISENQVSVSQ